MNAEITYKNTEGEPKTVKITDATVESVNSLVLAILNSGVADVDVKLLGY